MTVVGLPPTVEEGSQSNESLEETTLKPYQFQRTNQSFYFEKQDLRVRPPGLEWKTGRKLKMGKLGRKIEDGRGPELGKASQRAQ